MGPIWAKCHESYEDIINDWSHWRKLTFLGSNSKINRNRNDFSVKNGKKWKNSVEKSQNLSKLKKTSKYNFEIWIFHRNNARYKLRINQMPVSVIRDNDAIFSFLSFFILEWSYIWPLVDPTWPPAANQLNPVSICLIFMKRTSIIPVKSVQFLPVIPL